MEYATAASPAVSRCCCCCCPPHLLLSPEVAGICGTASPVCFPKAEADGGLFPDPGDDDDDDAGWGGDRSTRREDHRCKPARQTATSSRPHPWVVKVEEKGDQDSHVAQSGNFKLSLSA